MLGKDTFKEFKDFDENLNFKVRYLANHDVHLLNIWYEGLENLKEGDLSQLMAIMRMSEK